MSSPPSELTDNEVALRIASHYVQQQPDETMAHYERVHQYAVKRLPRAVAMGAKYPSTDHFITHFGFLGESTNTWNTESNFGNRYTLTMQVEIEIDYAAETFTVVGQPKFFLVEIASVRRDGYTTYGKQTVFGPDEFDRLLKSDWDYSAIGVAIKPTAVANWPIYEAMLRAPRYPISLVR